MDKTSIINNIQNKILIKNFSEWNHESIDNLLLIFRYPDCSEYYEDVLSLFKEYLQWRREGKDFNNENNYSTNRYNIQQATVGKIIYPSLDPCIFEVKYPNKDIKGRAL